MIWRQRLHGSFLFVKAGVFRRFSGGESSWKFIRRRPFLCLSSLFLGTCLLRRLSLPSGGDICRGAARLYAREFLACFPFFFLGSLGSFFVEISSPVLVFSFLRRFPPFILEVRPVGVFSVRSVRTFCFICAPRYRFFLPAFFTDNLDRHPNCRRLASLGPCFRNLPLGFFIVPPSADFPFPLVSFWPGEKHAL